MKVSGWLLRIGLFVMVALSVVFTWLIWQNPSRLGRPSTPPVAKTTTDPNIAKLAPQVFEPTTAYYQSATQKTLLFETETAVTSELRTEMAEWRLGTVGPTEKLSPTDYDQVITQPETLQLTYDTVMSYAHFNRTFFTHPATGERKDFSFTRLVVPLTGTPKSLLFINDRNRTQVAAKLTKAPLDKVAARVARATKTGFTVTEERLNGRMVADFTRPVTLAPYTFLLDTQNANHFVSLLMPAAQTSAVDTREIGDVTIFTLGSSYRLTQAENGAMSFDNGRATSDPSAFAKRLSKAYDALGTLNLQGLNTMHYFGYTPKTQTVAFRAYAQGLPIFNPDGSGLVEVANTSSGLALNFSLVNLTVAIPTAQSKVTLPTTEEVLDQLEQAGYSRNDIQDVVLGYDWQTQAADSQIVNLNPTYFVAIDGDYKPYATWLEPPTQDTAAEAGNH